jgi:hypothetical protein
VKLVLPGKRPVSITCRASAGMAARNRGRSGCKQRHLPRVIGRRRTGHRVGAVPRRYPVPPRFHRVADPAFRSGRVG